jgi:hypothetical protein
MLYCWGESLTVDEVMRRRRRRGGKVSTRAVM